MWQHAMPALFHSNNQTSNSSFHYCRIDRKAKGARQKRSLFLCRPFQKLNIILSNWSWRDIDNSYLLIRNSDCVGVFFCFVLFWGSASERGRMRIWGCGCPRHDNITCTLNVKSWLGFVWTKIDCGQRATAQTAGNNEMHLPQTAKGTCTRLYRHKQKVEGVKDA